MVDEHVVDPPDELPQDDADERAKCSNLLIRLVMVVRILPNKRTRFSQVC